MGGHHARRRGSRERLIPGHVTDPDTPPGGAAAARCVSCSIGRRTFLRDSALATAALAAISSGLGALPVHIISALAEHGNDVTYALPAGDSVNIDHDKEVILARVGPHVFAFDLSCPHQNTALRWLAGDKRFQCPKHKSLYSAEGVYLEGRATRSMDRHAIRRDGANVVVDIDKIYEEDHDVPEWKAAFLTV
jgi:nitrite reductase/ring-hydroxylating ferredoxin subunit